MNSSSTDSTETLAQTHESSSRPVQSIAARIAACAAQSAHQAEFLQLLAAELAGSFRVGIVAVESRAWSSPMMLVTDTQLGQEVDRASIRQLLQSARVAPVACDVPLKSTSGQSHVATRGLHLEVHEAPERAALLLIYSAEDAPSASDQIHDLKQLSLYGDAVRSSLLTVPASTQQTEGLTVQSSDAEQVPTSLALHQRRSLQLFHRDLDVDATAYRIANESRRLLQADRVTVLTPHGKGFRVRAISGVSVIDARSNSVRSTEELTRYATPMSRPLIFPSEELLPPQIQEPLDRYMDETGVTSALMLPLHGPDDSHLATGEDVQADLLDPLEGTGEVIAVLLLEYFNGEPPKSIGQAISIVAGEAVLALRNAQEHRSVFGLRLWKSVGSVVQTMRSPLIAASMMMAFGAFFAATVVKTEHYVIATGTAQPAQQRQVFATIDGIVKKIHVVDGQKIKAGDPILDLENAELESQLESLTGELITTTRRLASIQSVRLSEQDSTSARLVLEQRQLESEMANLIAQKSLIERQQAELTIKSPIDGTVVAWQLERRLSDRPVARGNLLVSIVDHGGPWILRMRIPDENAGPVISAFDQSKELPVRFAVATVPDGSYSATLTAVATATRMDETGEHVIDVSAMIDEQISPAQQNDHSFRQRTAPFNRTDVRVGADVTARIACGKRTVLRSWFGDVFDFVDRNVLFYVR